MTLHTPLRSGLLLALLALTGSGAWASHGEWLDHYRSATGTPCCQRQQDCRLVHARLTDQRGAWTIVEIEGILVEMPTLSVHLSEDASDYACFVLPGQQPTPVTAGNIRCLFLAVLG